MSKKRSNNGKPKETKGEGKIVPIKRTFPETLATKFANFATVQRDDQWFYLSFFEIVPPIVLGSEEEKRRQMDELTSVEAKCVSRIVFGPDQTKGLLKALSDQIRTLETKAEEQNG